MPTDNHPICPECGQPLQLGDGIHSPPLYCDHCRTVCDEADLDVSADLDAAEQWMHDHGGHPYQEGPDPSDELDDIPPFIEGEGYFD